MTVPSSSPPAAAHLDIEIQRIRAEIAKLRSQKKQLSSALLGSSRVQKHIHDRKIAQQARGDNDNSLQEKLDEAVAVQRRENDVRIHRLALRVTTFPFTDSAPERTGEHAMLGVRFDLGPTSIVGQRVRSTNTGYIEDAVRAGANEQLQQENENENAYFVMLRRLQHQGRTYLKVHHHTIPGHIDVEGRVDQYLPLPDALHDEDDENQRTAANNEESEVFEDDSGIDVTQDIEAPGTTHDAPQPNTNTTHPTPTLASPSQDFHQFTSRLRDDLQSWHNRTKSIAHLRHKLNLRPSPPADTDTRTGASPRSSLGPDLDAPSEAKHGVVALSQTTHDARHIKVIWADSTLGILRIAYDGTVDRAVVYGTTAPHTSTARESHSDSELSELDDDDGDTTTVHAHARVKGRSRDTVNVRLHDVERLLMVTEEGGDVMVHDLVDRLRVVDEKVFSA